MKVLFLVTDDWYFLSHRLDLARGARDAGMEVVVVTAPGSRVSEIEAEGFRHRPLRFHRTKSSQPRNLRVMLALTRIYEQERPDVAHHVSFLPIVFGSAAARRARVPAVVNAVTGLGHAFVGASLGRRLLRFGVERGYASAFRGPRQTVLFQNEDDREEFLARGLLKSVDCIVVPGSGVDTERFTPTVPEASEQSAPRVLHVSRMLWTKGVADSVEASRLLRERGVEHHLVLAGRTHPTNPESIPEERLRAWEEEGAATWLGHLEDVRPELARSRVVCLPSVYREGVPKALLEASASARPVVTTDVPGCRDAVADGESGMLIPVHAPERLARALESLLTQPELCERMGRAGRERMLRGFSHRMVVERTLDCYRKLLGQSDLGARGLSTVSG